MIELANVDQRLLDDITVVVDELEREVGLDPDQVLVVGAGCRDILHSALGHTFPVRATTDTDLGIAVGDWSISERLETRYRRSGTNGIRYLVNDLPVDIMPFGRIENPPGVSRPRVRDADLVVFGFRDVHERALRLPLSNGRWVRLPQAAGYAVLKMRSWIDRLAFEDKDARDLALAAFWYQESPEVRARLYDTDAGFEILTACGFDTDLAAVRILGLDAAGQLAPGNRQDLARRWRTLDLDTLARSFVLPVGARRPTGLDRRRALVAQLAG